MQAGPPRGNALLRVIGLVRYRFFLFAGLIPYLLGAAWAWRMADRFDPGVFFAGLFGVTLAVIGVEAFNEYFDARMGTDRVFNPQELPEISGKVFWLGVVAFAAALAMGVYLTVQGGWPVLAFAVLGGLAAIFYEAPPLRWSYRGLGELVIALAYGPWMVGGSYYLHVHAITSDVLLASLTPAFLVMALAVANAVPDFHQDRLVGKRNLVVRMGRERAVQLYVALALAGVAVPLIGVIAGWFPVGCLAALAGAPWLIRSAQQARRTFNTPRLFLPAIRSLLVCYLLTAGLLAAGLVLGSGS